MYSRAYKTVIAAPPLLWVCLFLLLPYALMLAHSFWIVRDGFLVHNWNLQNYRALFTNPLYFQVFLRTARIAGSVTLCSLLLGYPLAYYLSFHAGPRKELLYQLVIVPLWVSYLVRVRAVAWGFPRSIARRRALRHDDRQHRAEPLRRCVRLAAGRRYFCLHPPDHNFFVISHRAHRETLVLQVTSANPHRRVPLL